MTPHHPRLVELFAYLDEQFGVLVAALDAVPPERRADQPAPDRWSAVHVLEHLALTERRIAALFGRMLAKAAEAGIGPETDTSSILATFDEGRIVSRDVRITAPPHLIPETTRDWPEALAATREARDAMKSAIAQGDRLALATLSYPHPAIGPLNGYEWVAFAGAHMARHAAQIREIGEQLAASLAPRQPDYPA